MSRVSIVVPIYNPGKKLNKCIKSILNQTFYDFELILINDGSTDNSLRVCNKFKNIDGRIRVINKKSEGTVATRRKGIDISQSEYIMFVDADDWIDKKMVEILYNEAVINDLDISVSNTFLTLGNGIIKRENKSYFFKQPKIFNEEEIKKEIATSYFRYGDAYPASLCSKLFKKELLSNCGKFIKRIHFFGDDLFYNLEMLFMAKRVKIIGEPLYYYRMGGFTNKYMPYYFDDIISGYQIQKEIINEYYRECKQDHYKSISTTLLIMFRNGLYNLFYGDLSEVDIKNIIKMYVSTASIIESVGTVDVIDILPKDYLNAVMRQDIDFLYSVGEYMFRRKRAKRLIKNMISNLTFN